MPTDAFRIWTLVSALPERVYSAWMDSSAHTAFTGGEAKIDPVIGGKFTAWDGYIQGRTVDILPGRRIVQTWRTKEFPTSAPDSRLEVQLEPAEGGTRITILHSAIPLGQGERYKQGWAENYFQPMKEHFARIMLGPGAPSRKGKGAAKRPSSPPVGPKKGVAKTAVKPLKKLVAKGKPAKAKPASKKKPAKAAGTKKAAPSARKSGAKAAAKRPAKKTKGRRR